MSLNVKHAEGAYSAGTTQFDRWDARVTEEWYRPVVRTQLAMFLKSLPPEIAGRYSQEIKNLEETIGVEQQHGGTINAEIQRPYRYGGGIPIQQPSPIEPEQG